ncbi:MAG: cysteine peptidase family C39 domain-containing protein, partial [Waterburya sp.]
MVQNISKISRQQISNVLGYTFSESEFSNCLQQIKTIKPKVGKFWQTEGAEAGVYIVVQGKVRLIDSSNELITNLITGESFGEATFFPDAGFKAYSARAARNLELCYLPPELLLTLVRKHPEIQEHLNQQAQKNDSLFANSEQTLVLTKPDNELVEILTDTKQKTGRKVNKAYFPDPSLKIGHLWQKVTHRYPFYAQQSASDCGAACLVMIGRYWGKKFSVSRLRDIANVDRNGSSLKGLASAAESIGFTTRPVKASLDKLGIANLPAIAHWSGKHYIVVYQVTKDRVIVCDPAIGQRSLSHEEF